MLSLFLPPFEMILVDLKAHEALFVDDLSPLMAKSSSEMMSSHIQKLVQVSVASYFLLLLLFALLLPRGKKICRLWGSLCSSREGSWT